MAWRNSIGQYEVKFEKVGLDSCVLDGPFEYSGCGGHLLLDGIFLDQQPEDEPLLCPYCWQVCNANDVEE